MANYLVLLAGGRGRRFGGDKLTAEILGIRVKDWSRFYIDPNLWDAIVWVGQNPSEGIPISALAVAGETRHESWINGAKVLQDLFDLSREDKVVFHDVARPFVTPNLFNSVVAYLDRCDVVFPVVRPSDALRRKSETGKWITVSREGIHRVQTPQGFKGWVVKQILEHSTLEDVYDEVDMAVSLGAKICAIPGEAMNVKITYPEDLLSIRSFLQRFWRGIGAVGLGADFHLLEKVEDGGGIPVGGVLIDASYRPIAWSDGDALLHSLIDAILSAIGFEGDIGTLYPPGSEEIRGASSVHLLKKILQVARISPCQMSSVVFTEVRLSPYREKILASLREITECNRVAVTFKSLEGMRYDIYGAITVVAITGGADVGGKGL